MTRPPNTDPIPIPELSKIYPTPPSVEASEKRYDENDGMEERESAMMWDGEVGEGGERGRGRRERERRRGEEREGRERREGEMERRREGREGEEEEEEERWLTCQPCALSDSLPLPQSLLEDEVNLVPLEFAPLSLSPRPKLPKHCVYVQPSTVRTPPLSGACDMHVTCI